MSTMKKLKYSDITPEFSLRSLPGENRGICYAKGAFTPEIIEAIRSTEFHTLTLGVGDWLDLRPLIEKGGLRRLSIRSDSVDWAAVSDLPNLISLTVDDGLGSKIPYGECTSLKTLQCHGSDKYLEQVFDMPNLEYLFIRNLKERDLSRFAGLKNLKKLELIDARKLESLDGIEQLTALEDLCLDGKPKLTDVSALNRLPDLKLLEIAGCNHIQWPADLSGLSNLRYVLLKEMKSLESIRMFSQCKLLAFFINYGVPVKDGDIAFLRDLPHLKRLSFPPKKHYNLDFEYLQAELVSKFGEWPSLREEDWYQLREWYFPQ
jgi:hypothetical protein